MPLEPPPTKVTQAFLEDIHSSLFQDGCLNKSGVRCMVGIDFRTNSWTVSERGTIRLAKPTYTMLCNAKAGSEGGFVENADPTERFLVSVMLDSEQRWNLLLTPVDREAYFGNK